MYNDKYESNITTSPWLLILGFLGFNFLAFIAGILISIFWYPITYFEAFGILTFSTIVVRIITEIIEYYFIKNE